MFRTGMNAPTDPMGSYVDLHNLVAGTLYILLVSFNQCQQLPSVASISINTYLFRSKDVGSSNTQHPLEISNFEIRLAVMSFIS